MTEPHSHDALWYGYFHYDKAQGFDDHFTAAHLKTREQERMLPRARIAAQEHAFSRMRTGQGGRVTQTLEVHYEKIHLVLARKLFFPAPPLA